MLPYFSDYFGNPGSLSHPYGWEAEAAIQSARLTLATAIAAEPEDIIFTSGATEANNLAIKGVAEAYHTQGRHLITVATEHSAVLDPCRYLQTLGFELTILGVDAEGLISLTDLAAALRPDTILVSVMAANNETGILQPLAEIGQLCREASQSRSNRHKILFHTDAAQAIGKIPLNVQTAAIDLMSLTAHKIYGPKGVGALYVRHRQPRVQLAPQLHGGGQERGLRSGTLNPPLIVGMAKAVELAIADMPQESQRLLNLRSQLWQQLQGLPGLFINGSWQHRLPGNLNLSVADVSGAAVMLGLRSQLAISSGSACASGNAKPSHVLQAMGRTPELAAAALRFGIGRFNTEAEMNTAAQVVIATIQALRQGRSELMP